jgi:hypothetical protein
MRVSSYLSHAQRHRLSVREQLAQAVEPIYARDLAVVQLSRANTARSSRKQLQHYPLVMNLYCVSQVQLCRRSASRVLVQEQGLLAILLLVLKQMLIQSYCGATLLILSVLCIYKMLSLIASTAV